ncbi:MAG: hypothetical protein CSA07_00905 [Bacteroidia bacterium]|nr:MAG: hypothetical protein CSA07_00905 [Bacteroidia bacterium]
MLAIVFVSCLVVGFAFLAFSLRIFFHHSHRFPEDVGESKAMRERGICCPRVEDAREQRAACGSCALRGKE